MGTVNYGTGDIITFGTDNTYGYEEIEFGIYQRKSNNLYEKIKELLEKYDFEWFKIELDYGYYEGVYVAINKNYYTQKEIERDKLPLYFKLDQDDLMIIKEELKDLKKLMYALSSIMPITYPGWCMGYEKDPFKKVEEIEEALKGVRKEVEKEAA